MAKKKQYHRAPGLRPQRLDAGRAWGRTKRFVSPLRVEKGEDPDVQYRLCGICKVRGEHGFARYIAVLPGRTAWVNLCPKHFHEYGCKLGPERGQRLVINPRWAEQRTAEERENQSLARQIQAREEEAEKERIQKVRQQ